MRRLRFLKHMIFALIGLVGLLCCAEVGWRIYLVSADDEVVATGIPVQRSHRLHHQLPPLTVLETTHPDTDHPVPIELNSLGLRGVEPSLNKPPGTLRILCLGDDMTFGPGLRIDELFTSRLREMLSELLPGRVEVINAGVPDYCPLLSYLQYRHQLHAYQPNVIVLTFDMSDVADDHAIRSFTRLDPEGAPLACRHPGLDAPLRGKAIEDQFLCVRWLKCRLGEIGPGNNYAGFEEIGHPAGRYAWIRETPPDWEPYIRNALEPIAQLRELSASVAPLFLLSVVPSPWQVSEQAANDPELRHRHGIAEGVLYSSRDPFERLYTFAVEQNLPFLDASFAISQAGNPEDLYLRRAPWMSARGHELYATLLAGYLLPQLGLPTSQRGPTDVLPAGYRQGALP